MGRKEQVQASPKAGGDLTAGVSAPCSLDGLRAMNLLVIEDEARVADLILHGTRSKGWMVTHAPDAETALSLTLQETFDVILLDLMLPNLSVHDFCRKLRHRRDHTPVLVLPALKLMDTRAEGLRIGADDFLVKPIAFDKLIVLIEALARR